MTHWTVDYAGCNVFGQDLGNISHVQISFGTAPAAKLVFISLNYAML